jgi:hypothetical protein
MTVGFIYRGGIPQTRGGENLLRFQAPFNRGTGYALGTDAAKAEVSSRTMKVSWLTRFSVQLAALTIAFVAPIALAKTANTSSALPSSPLDALASDPLPDNHAKQQSSNTPADHGSLQLPRVGVQGPLRDSGSQRRHHGSIAPPGDCTMGGVPSPTTSEGLHKKAHGVRPGQLPPTPAPCPPSTPPSSGGTNCDSTVPVSTPIPIITPPVIAPPTTNTGSRRGHHRQPAALPPTTADAAAATVTTTATSLPCPPPAPTAGGTNGDNSGGFTDVIGSSDNNPHHKPRRLPPNQAPEPGTLTLLALGLGSLWLGRRRLSKRR